MEAIGLVASISGIIQLTVYGIKTIELLKQFLQNCEGDVVGDFVHGLISSARLLQDTQTLCNRVSKHENPKVSQMRTASLQVQLEDCIRDVEVWYGIARSIEQRAKQPLLFSKARRAGTSLHPTQRFERFMKGFMKAIMKTTAVVTTSDARAVVQKHFQEHIANITLALSIFQTDLQFICIDNVSKMDATVHKLVNITEQLDLKLRSSSSAQQNSENSNHAQSRSEQQQLEDLQSLSSISDKLDMVLRVVLSSHGSHSSSTSSRNIDDNGLVPEGMDRNGLQISTDTDEAPPSATAPLTVVATEGNLLAPEDDSFSETDDPTSMSKLIDDFHLLAGQLFDEIITEYISTAGRWRIVCNQSKLADLIEQNSLFQDIGLDIDLSGNVRKLATRLIALRHRAEVECLHLQIEQADQLLNIDDDQLAVWKDTANQTQENITQRSLMLPGYSGQSQLAESLTRMNEWLFEAMMADRRLQYWHQALTLERINLTNPNTHLSLPKDEWERLTIKSWFFDGADPQNYERATTSFTDSHESDLTVLPYESDSIVGDGQNGDMDLVDSEHRALIKQPYISRSQLMQLRRGINEVHSWITSAPDQSSAVFQRARDALKAYQLEPSRQAESAVLSVRQVLT